MRHPVSTMATSRGEERLRGAMPADVVGCVIVRAAPEDAGPRAGEDADRVLMPTAAGPRALIHESRPGRGVPGVIGEGGDGAAQALVAGPAKDDGAVLAGGMRDGRQAGLGGELLVGGKPRAIVAELGEDLRGVDGAAAREALHEPAIGMLRERGLDSGGELLEVRHERGEDGDERADDLAARLGFRLADLARGGAAEAGAQLGDGAPAPGAVLAQGL